MKKAKRAGARGSFWFGIIWTLFSSIFLVMGLLAVFQSLFHTTWDKVPCVIERFGIRADLKQSPPFQPDLRFRYSVDGREFTSDRLWPRKNGADDYEKLSNSLEEIRLHAGRDAIEGAAAECHVNPANPTEAFLLPSTGDLWGGLLFATVGGLFVLIGISIMRMAPGKSPEIFHTGEEAPAGSPKGRLLGIAFCGVFATGGLAMIGGMIIPAVTKKTVSSGWVETPAEVVWSRIVEHGSGEDRSTKPDIFYRYTFAGREYHSNRYDLGGGFNGDSAKHDLVRSHPVGTTLLCYVNPRKPWQAIVDRNLKGSVAMFLFPIPFTLVGVGGLVGMWWWPRYQRKLKLKADSTLSWRGKPSEQGVVLTGGSERLVALLGIGFATIFWNSIVGVFVSIAVSEWQSGHPQMFLNLFLIPFVIVGLGLLLVCLNRLLQFRRPSYEVRLVPGALAPGDEGSITWRRSEGRGQPGQLSILLIAVKSIGSDDGKQEKVVHKETLAEIQQPGDCSFQPIRLKIPTTPAGVVWKIRLAPRMASWLPAVPEDLKIPDGKPGIV
ncbi:DUF3592 domain-containing protein [Luteolibacter ambystomatis]|uniref:DUF3592 domain-containing protein n=1 Tax=Luteolibacter ambystomatis TaxID=2824561 RepID=A0A975IZ47_9BACT|nr:DUF3592 domain-containing protein [Luteolibacter ambystomatis]QUE50548.1 DUF3592 domain-containing protein [Luteolibacter ambystomatis]